MFNQLISHFNSVRRLWLGVAFLIGAASTNFGLGQGLSLVGIDAPWGIASFGEMR
jgi:hypothetical protein